MTTDTARIEPRIAYPLAELAELTGLSRRTIGRAVAAGALPVQRPTGGVAIALAADVETWLRTVPASVRRAPGAHADATAVAS